MTTTEPTLSRADEMFIRGFEVTMDFFSRVLNPKDNAPVTAEDLRESFTYLTSINPDGAEDLMQSFRHTVKEPDSPAICPSELPSSHRTSLMQRTEAAIRAAEGANHDTLTLGG